MKKNILVAAAWPYANTSLHLGHIAGLLGADILARYHRLAGDNVLYVSGSDCHGTPISVEADKLGVDPRQIAEKYHKEFVNNLINGLNFSYDLYTTTLTKNHEQVVQELFLALYNAETIYKKEDNLPYCKKCDRFLADRFVEGECPNCHFHNARGDQCDECGHLLDPIELINPKCKICGNTPEWRPSEHFYLKLTAFQDFLEQWTSKSLGWKVNAKGFAGKLLKEGLHDRSITRDTNWGIPIPLPGYDGKRIYVWFEAVIGYLSASKEWSEQSSKPDEWKKWWQNDEATHYYVHGKDNIPFHAIIWPAILHGVGGLHLPDRIISSEFLTLEGKQFSKSRRWAVWLNDFLADFDSETLRFWLVVGGPETSDADFSWKDFQQRINSELIGKIGNFVNRNLSIINANFKDGISVSTKPTVEQQKLLELATESFKKVGEQIPAGHFRQAFKDIISLAEAGNRFIDSAAPWTTVKTDCAKTESDLAVSVQLIRCFAILLEPFLPKTSLKIWDQLNEKPIKIWSYPAALAHFSPKKATPIFKRIEDTEVEAQDAKLRKDKI